MAAALLVERLGKHETRRACSSIGDMPRGYRSHKSLELHGLWRVGMCSESLRRVGRELGRDRADVCAFETGTEQGEHHANLPIEIGASPRSHSVGDTSDKTMSCALVRTREMATMRGKVRDRHD